MDDRGDKAEVFVMSLVVTMASQLMTTLELLQQGSDDGTDVWMDGWMAQLECDCRSVGSELCVRLRQQF